MLKNFVATLLICIIIWLGISLLPTYNTYVIGMLLFLLLSVTILLIFLVSSLLWIAKKLLHKDTGRIVKNSMLLSIVILISIIASKLIINQFSPDYVGRINREINKVVIDENIPQKDAEEIKKLAQALSKDKGIRISYYECKRTLPDLENDEKTICIGGPKKSQMCQEGDVFLEIRGGYYVSPLGSERRFKYFLLRKINNKWEVIEDLGESGWVS